MKLALLLLSLWNSSPALAKAPRLLNSFETTFRGGQRGLVQVYDTGSEFRALLRVTIGAKTSTYDDFVVMGQRVSAAASGFEVSEHDGDMDNHFQESGKTAHVDLVEGALAVADETEFSMGNHHMYGEAKWDNRDSINYVTGDLSYRRTGDGEDNVVVDHARLPESCRPPRLEDYKRFSPPACALEAMK